MGKERRKKLGDGEGIPGPGSYNTKMGCKCDTNGFSFGRDKRGKKINTTPGFYKLPASIPDVPSYLLPPMRNRKINLIED